MIGSAPKKNTAFKFSLPLVVYGGDDHKAAPTLAAGDFQVSIDGGAFANLTNLPAETAASSKQVEFSLTAAEMNGDRIYVRCIDQTPIKEWKDTGEEIFTQVNTPSEVYARQGPPAGASQSADAAAIKADTAAIKTRVELALPNAAANAANGLHVLGGTKAQVNVMEWLSQAVRAQMGGAGGVIAAADVSSPLLHVNAASAGATGLTFKEDLGTTGQNVGVFAFNYCQIRIRTGAGDWACYDTLIFSRGDGLGVSTIGLDRALDFAVLDNTEVAIKPIDGLDDIGQTAQAIALCQQILQTMANGMSADAFTSGNCQNGGTITPQAYLAMVVIAAGDPNLTNTLVNKYLIVFSGPGAGQAGLITANEFVSKQVLVSTPTPWATATTAASTYVIFDRAFLAKRHDNTDIPTAEDVEEEIADVHGPGLYDQAGGGGGGDDLTLNIDDSQIRTTG